MTNANTLRRLNWLWKHRHTHDDEDFGDQITVIERTIETIEEDVGSIGSGSFIHLVGLSASIAAGGEAVEWVGLMSGHPLLEFQESFPTTTVTIRKPGYYDFQVYGRWETWLAGGSMALTRTRDGVTVQIWPSASNIGVWSIPTNDRLGPATAKGIRCEAGDVFTLQVDHGSASAQDLAEAWMVAELVDRTIATTPSASSELLVWTADDTHDFGAGTLLSDVYVIAGGGGGGGNNGSSTYRGGGGGAGGVLHLTDYTATGIVTITVGAGGLGEDNGFAGGDGADSAFDGQTATGGGGGGGNAAANGRAGGSGGGGAGDSSVSSGGTGVSGQGFAGGDGGSDGPARGGGGGGGAGAVGTDGNVPVGNQGGAGGVGVDLTSIVGTDYGEAGWFAGGGGGALSGSTSGLGGQGGGGRSERHSGAEPGEDGQINTGGGGGGGHNSGESGDGGSGIVIAVPA